MTRSGCSLSQPGEPVGDRVRDVHVVPVLLEIDSQTECKVLVILDDENSSARVAHAGVD